MIPLKPQSSKFSDFMNLDAFHQSPCMLVNIYMYNLYLNSIFLVELWQLRVSFAVASFFDSKGVMCCRRTVPVLERVSCTRALGPGGRGGRGHHGERQ